MFPEFFGGVFPCMAGYVNASFDPRLRFSGVHIANWVEKGNITVADLSST